MRTGDGIKDYQDRAYPKNAREQGTADLPEPECKNPRNLSRNLAESSDIRG
jgi:hypothetical protein